MASGVAVHEDVKKIYQQVKMTKKDVVKLPYAVFKISDNLKQIELDPERMPSGEAAVQQCQGEEDLTKAPLMFSSLINSLPADDGRYIVFDYPFDEGRGRNSKVIFVRWVPDNANVKKKMIYASSTDALKKCLSDVGGEIQAASLEDLDHKEVVGKLSRGKGKC